jgi:phage shock protein PspC (stress-responsive transcriptional regulator)
MDRTILIGLSGHAEQFQLEAAAAGRLSRYLDRAAVGLQDDPDRAEVLGDLERSVGDRLLALPEVDGRVVTVAEVEAILEAMGTVETGGEPVPEDVGAGPRRRRLRRIRDGQEIAGVCTGIAAYAEVDVEWVRTVVILGTLVTGGILGLVYIALVLILPVSETREARR